MAKINLLTPSIFNRIAAGEVVENPASIVKELVENSIDAGATRVEIAIFQGGIKEISVIDNGLGIEKAYIKEAFLPHATSKIAKEEDLYAIKTLGFRGEALASVAAVSYVELLTKNAVDDVGTSILIKGGEIEKISAAAREHGTSVTVTNLFYNTPVRYKFLKSVKKEESNITSLVQKIVLSNPFVEIKYSVDGKIVLNSNGKGLCEAVKSVYPDEISDNLIPVCYKKYEIEIDGFIGNPTLFKTNRTYQTLIINKRFVVDLALSSAVNTAYKDYLMKGNFPVFILNLNVPHEIVDVNVHPHKTEVRFAKGNELYGIIVSALRGALEAYQKQESEKLFERYFSNTETVIEKTERFDNSKKSIDPILTLDEYVKTLPFKTDILKEDDSSLLEAVATLDDYIVHENNQTDAEIYEKENYKNNLYFKTIGQLFNTYILLEKENSFYLIDQHASHERFIYDKIQKEISEKNIVVQPLFVPYILNFSAQEFAFIKDNLETLNSFGIDAVEFGNNCIKISALPDVLLNLNVDAYFNELLADMTQLKQIKDSFLIKEKLMQKACKAAIKGGDRLSSEQIEFILSAFLKDGFPMQCPHGRPTIVEITKSQIEKWFRRTI